MGVTRSAVSGCGAVPVEHPRRYESDRRGPERLNVSGGEQLLALR